MEHESSLEKLTITPYADKELKDQQGESFKVMFNPESYSLKYENKFSEAKSIGADRAPERYSFTKPEALSITLIMDNTGVAESGQGGPGGAAMHVKDYDVYKKVQAFLKATCYMDGPTHEPLYLKLEWGDLVFHCRLVSVNVSYTLFNRQGRPIRAELACEFKGSLQLSQRVQKSSPDLSHSRLVEAEDNITIMTNKIYKNPAYYIRVAQANRLNNFRRLPMELELQFPPLEK